MQNVLKCSMTVTLQQGVKLLNGLSGDQYIETVPSAFHSCIGNHYRHSLEHFEAILPGDRPGWVDYDARKRDARVETDISAALARTEQLLERAAELQADSLEDGVRVRCGVGPDEESPVVGSTLGREIMYAVIHAVHHYAIIRMMCNQLGVEQPEGFGVAPSTLRYQTGNPAGT